jgi:hypothetical protein
MIRKRLDKFAHKIGYSIVEPLDILLTLVANMKMTANTTKAVTVAMERFESARRPSQL